MLRRLTVLILALAAGAITIAQGTFNFANIAAAVNAPIFDCDGVTRLAGDVAWVQAYAGPDYASLTPVGAPIHFLTGAQAGYFLGGQQTVTGVPTGGTALIQVRVWSAPFSSWDAVMAAYHAGDPRAEFGWTGPIWVPSLGGGPVPPPNLIGLQSTIFSTCIPEPTTIVLGLLGGLVVLIRRRR